MEFTQRCEVVVSFMALRELLKSAEADAQQADAWGDIEVVALEAHVLA